MENVINSVFPMIFILALSLLGRGLAEQCDLSNVQYKVERSGKIVQDQTEWNVMIYHTCKTCSLGNIVLSNCKDWQTAEAEPVDPAIFSKNGDLCRVKGGQVLKPGETVNFSFAWNSPVFWVPEHAEAQC